MLPDELSFDAFEDEDQIFDLIGILDESTRRIFFDALDKTKGEEIILYARPTSEPELHLILMKFPGERDGGLVLLLSRTENHIYSYFERLKEDHPKRVDYINKKVAEVYELIKQANTQIQT